MRIPFASMVRWLIWVIREAPSPWMKGIVCSRAGDHQSKGVTMARLQPITSKEQVPAKDHAIVDAIAQSRGAIQGPFTMFLHCPELAGRVADRQTASEVSRPSSRRPGACGGVGA